MATVQLIVITVICLVCTAPNGLVLPDRVGDWVSVLYMAVFAGAGAMIGQTWAQAHLPPTRAAIIMSMEPVFAALFAVLLGGESATVRMIVGGLLVLAAMLLAELAPRRQGRGRGHPSDRLEPGRAGSERRSRPTIDASWTAGPSAALHCGATVTRRSVLHQLRRTARHRADQPPAVARTDRHGRRVYETPGSGGRRGRAVARPAGVRRRPAGAPDRRAGRASRPGPGPGLLDRRRRGDGRGAGARRASCCCRARRRWRRPGLDHPADRAEDPPTSPSHEQLASPRRPVGSSSLPGRRGPARPTSPASPRPRRRPTPRQASTSPASRSPTSRPTWSTAATTPAGASPATRPGRC